MTLSKGLGGLPSRGEPDEPHVQSFHSDSIEFGNLDAQVASERPFASFLHHGSGGNSGETIKRSRHTRSLMSICNRAESRRARIAFCRVARRKLINRSPIQARGDRNAILAQPAISTSVHDDCATDNFTAIRNLNAEIYHSGLPCRFFSLALYGLYCRTERECYDAIVVMTVTKCTRTPVPNLQQKTRFISSRTQLRVWGWNAEGLSQAGSLHASLQIIKPHRVGIGYIHETNLPFSTDFQLEGYRSITCGIADEEKVQMHAFQGMGTGVWLSVRAQKALGSFRQHSSRLFELTSRSICGQATFFGAHAPHEFVKKDIQTSFWTLLRHASEALPLALPIYIIGDMNTRLHARLLGEEQVLGNFIFGRWVEYLNKRRMRRWAVLVRENLRKLRSKFLAD